MNVDGLLFTEERAHPGSLSSFIQESCPQLPQLGQVDAAKHWEVESCTMQFPHLIILITNFPGSKGINSQIRNTKLNLSSHRKVVSRAEFCSQTNRSNGGWTHKKGPRIWTEFKASAGSMSQEKPVCGRKGQEKPLQSNPDQRALPCWQIWLYKRQPLSLQSSGFWSCL